MSEGKRVLKKQELTGEQASHQRAGRLVVMNALLAAVVLLTLGALAWFYSQQSAATVTVMGDPADLAIVGEDGGELRLDMSPADATVAEGRVTVSRLFGVKTTNTHWIEVAHTTNMDGLSFKIYLATPNAPVPPDGRVAFTIGQEIQGQYQNEDTAVSGTALSGDSYYDGNFLDSDNVQINAVPLYWVVDDALDAPVSGGIAYYYLVAEWSENEKETDVIYIFVSDS